MKKIITIVACLFMASLQASYAQGQLKLNQSQIDNLGIKTQQADLISAVWSRSVPGKIVIPNMIQNDLMENDFFISIFLSYIYF